MEKFNCNTFCDRVNSLFGDEGQMELSKKLDLSQGVISAIKNKKVKAPGADTIYKIAAYFNVSADWLLGMTDEKTTDKATKEQCATLGLSETAIEHLKNDKDGFLKNATNFLFAQHRQTVDFEKQLRSWPIGKEVPLRFLNYHSILKELDELIKLCNAENDISITLGQSDTVSIEWVHDGSMERIFVPQIDPKLESNSTSLSLLRVASKQKIDFIRDLLFEYAHDKYEKNISSQIWNWAEEQQSKEDNTDE